MGGSTDADLHPRYERIVKRSIVISGQRTSVSLEGNFWRALRAIAYVRRINTSTLVAEIGARRGSVGLSSALRQFVLFYVQNKGRGYSMPVPPKSWIDAPPD